MSLYKIQTKFLQWFSHIKVYKTPLWLTVGPTSYKLKGDDYYSVRDQLRPGDILLRGYDNYLDGFFIPGKYSHAGIYVGDEKVIHAMTPAVQYTNLVDWMRCDRMAIVRPNVSHSWCEMAVEDAIGYLGVPYDYNFDFGNTADVRFSCSELVYKCYKPVRKELGWDLKNAGLGKMVFTPDDCLKGEVTVIEEL
jgi:uncharacterized protein YycO